MNENHRRDTEPLPADPVLGDEETVVGTPVENPELILELTLSLDTTRILSAAARAADMSLPRYILRAAMQMAQRELGHPNLQ